jgi:hypothetical protein
METLSNAANSASKMIWGDKTGDATAESGQEPISGEQGKGTVEEPFDRGNEGACFCSSSSIPLVPS